MRPPAPKIVQSDVYIQLSFTVFDVLRMYAVAKAAAKKTNDWTVVNHLTEAHDLAQNELAKDRVGG